MSDHSKTCILGRFSRLLLISLQAPIPELEKLVWAEHTVSAQLQHHALSTHQVRFLWVSFCSLRNLYQKSKRKIKSKIIGSKVLLVISVNQWSFICRKYIEGAGVHGWVMLLLHSVKTQYGKRSSWPTYVQYIHFFQSASSSVFPANLALKTSLRPGWNTVTVSPLTHWQPAADLNWGQNRHSGINYF